MEVEEEEERNEALRAEAAAKKKKKKKKNKANQHAQVQNLQSLAFSKTSSKKKKKKKSQAAAAASTTHASQKSTTVVGNEPELVSAVSQSNPQTHAQVSSTGSTSTWLRPAASRSVHEAPTSKQQKAPPRHSTSPTSSGERSVGTISRGDTNGTTEASSRNEARHNRAGSAAVAGKSNLVGGGEEAIQLLRTDNDLLRATAASLRDQVTSLQQQNTALAAAFNANNQGSAASVAQLEAANNELHATVQELREQNAQLQAHASRLEEVHAGREALLREELAAVKLQHQQLLDTVNAMSQSVLRNQTHKQPHPNQQPAAHGGSHLLHPHPRAQVASAPAGDWRGGAKPRTSNAPAAAAAAGPLSSARPLNSRWKQSERHQPGLTTGVGQRPLNFEPRSSPPPPRQRPPPAAEQSPPGLGFAPSKKNPGHSSTSVESAVSSDTPPPGLGGGAQSSTSPRASSGRKKLQLQPRSKRAGPSE